MVGLTQLHMELNVGGDSTCSPMCQRPDMQRISSNTSLAIHNSALIKS